MAETLRDKIKVPQMWQLALEIHEASLEAVFRPLLPHDEMLHIAFELPSSTGRLEAIEEIVYENPILLSEFNASEIFFDTRRFTFMPTAWANDEAASDMVHALWPSLQYEAVIQPVALTDESLIMAIDSDLLAFVRRTFLEARIVHPLGKLIEYFASRNQGNQNCLYAYVRPNCTYIAGFRDATLCIANQFATPTADDTAYYIMAAAKQHGFDMSADALMVCGDAKLRQSVIELLQSMHANAMPALMPESAMSSEWPLELLI